MLTQFSRAVNRLHRRPDAIPQQFTDCHDVGLFASTDIHGARIVGIEGRDIGSHDIADKNIITSLFAVAVDHGTFAGKELRNEYRDDAGLA